MKNGDKKQGNVNARQKISVKQRMKLFNERRLSFEDFFCAFLASFAAAGAYTVGTASEAFTAMSFMNGISLRMFFLILAMVFVFLVSMRIIFMDINVIPRALLTCVVLFSLILANSNQNSIYFNVGLALVIGCVAHWLSADDKLALSRIKPVSYKACLWFAVGGFVAFTALISYGCILRYMNYAPATFDMGIFTQMFESMRKTGLPYTTLERNYPLSHFGVHFSPFYYLLLPGYTLFPYPQYLLIAQAAAVGSGVFAVYAICKRLDYSPNMTIGFELLFLLLPSMIGGLFFDFHENKFLTFLVLWLFYFILKENKPFTFVFAFLVLTIKEDAAIYVMAIALYIIISRRKLWIGLSIGMMAVVYFIFAQSVVARLGEGVMMSRLSTYMPTRADGLSGGFGDVAKTIFLNIGYLIANVFTQNRFPFLLWVFTPLLFTPFVSVKKSEMLLLVPMLVVNLMPEWYPQYGVTYQYTYGSVALAFIASILAIRRMSPHAQRSITLICVCVALIFTVSLNAGQFQTHYEFYKNNRERLNSIKPVLDVIPPGSTVAATEYFTPRLYRFDELYDVNHYLRTEYYMADYFVANPMIPKNKEHIEFYMAAGYIPVASSESFPVIIYRKPDIH